jgi:hypothetical protein
MLARPYYRAKNTNADSLPRVATMEEAVHAKMSKLRIGDWRLRKAVRQIAPNATSENYSLPKTIPLIKD